MKPSAAAQSLRTLITARRPAFLRGPPGIGKSDLVREAAYALSLDLIDVRAILLTLEPDYPVVWAGMRDRNGTFGETICVRC